MSRKTGATAQASLADPKSKQHTPSGADCETGNRRFRRRDRILDKASYGRVFKTARRSRDAFFTVLYRRNERCCPRLGLAIAKKHCKLATGRNRLKRLVRESFRQNKQALSGLDVVVINTPTTHRADNRTLSESLDRHWRQCSRPTDGTRNS